MVLTPPLARYQPKATAAKHAPRARHSLTSGKRAISSLVRGIAGVVI